MFQIIPRDKSVQDNLQDPSRRIYDFLYVRFVQLVLLHEDTQRSYRASRLVRAEI